MTSREPELLIRSDFDVYLDRDDNHLIVFRQHCRKRDTRARFFLDVFAADVTQPQGFDGLAFDFDSRRLAFAACSDMSRAGNKLIFDRNRCDNDGGAGARLSTVTPAVGVSLKTSLIAGDPAKQVSREAWRWERSADAGGWIDVSRSGARPTWRYVPGAADLGRRLRARTYWSRPPRQSNRGRHRAVQAGGVVSGPVRGLA